MINEEQRRLVEELKAAFPTEPVPAPGEAADLKILHEGELDDLLGRSWTDVLADRGLILGSDALMLTVTGLRYYLPFFVGEAVQDPYGNFELWLGITARERGRTIVGDHLTKPQIQALRHCVSFMIRCNLDESRTSDPLTADVLSDLHQLQSALDSAT